MSTFFLKLSFVLGRSLEDTSDMNNEIEAFVSGLSLAIVFPWMDFVFSG